MSRSYRKTLIKTDHGPSTKYYKRLASKKIRRVSVDDYIADGNSYKKYFESWEICDFKFYYDPEPLVWSFMGKIRIIEPDPIYKWRNK